MPRRGWHASFLLWKITYLFVYLNGNGVIPSTYIPVIVFSQVIMVIVENTLRDFLVLHGPCNTKRVAADVLVTVTTTKVSGTKIGN